MFDTKVNHVCNHDEENKGQRPETAPAVRMTLSGRQGVEIMVSDVETDQVHVLNEASAAIWDGIKAGLDVPGIEGRLHEQYDLGGHADPAAMILESLMAMVGKGLHDRAGCAGEIKP